MAYSIPHHASNSGNTAIPSVNITSPTSGNLLVVFGWTTSSFSSPPTGWTNQTAVSGTLGHKSYFKISDGTETAFSTSTGGVAPWALCYIEIAGFATGSTPTVDQWSWNTNSSSGPSLSNSAINNGTAGSVTPSCPTTQPNEIGLSGAGWDPPEFGEYGWIDGVRIRIVRGGHSGGKSAGSFTEGDWGSPGTAYTSLDTTTAQVNAAANSSYTGNTPLASSTDVSTFSSGALFQYSVSGPATVSLLSFYGLITSLPGPIQVINAAINRASTF